MATYRTGTITVTNGSKTVTGASTLFKTAGVVSGDQLYIVDANNIPTGYLYEVDVVDSDTLITLKQNYQGATISDQSYMIMNMAGNQTVPNFAARLAPIMQSWGDITENINTTPQINGIPQAGETGKIDSGWVSDASTTVKGVVKIGTNLSATNGVITVATSSATAKGVVELATNAEVIQGTDTERAVTPAGLLAGFPTRLRSNLLGTVSQTGGVPTGAVIESGSNANGSYVKFADGTMICNGGGILAYVNASSLNKAVTFAAEYINTNYCPLMSTPTPAAGHRESTLTFSNFTTTGVTFSIIDNTTTYSAGNTLAFTYTIIGRWY